MATTRRPDPLVVIIGSTGTGKSDLAVELALRFNGEIINSDAMQMYNGMPITTNKMTAEEQRGVPHHLLGNIELDQDTWHVLKFKTEATRIIDEIRQRGRLPIVVGGTHYYVDSLLSDDQNIKVEVDVEEMPSDAERPEHPILNAPPALVLQKLREVDPVMADRWHPNEIRKIRRSLEIYLNTGRRASEIYAEQAKRCGENKVGAAWPALLFWVYSEPAILEERLRNRVDKMVDSGLLDETKSQLDHCHELVSAGTNIDRSRGIWQSVGLKELEPYFNSTARPPDLLEECIETMKVATRQCAKAQLRWISLKTMPALKRNGMADALYLVDSSDMLLWNDQVVSPAQQITERFLAGAPVPDPTSISTTARKVLLDDSHKKGVPCRRICDVCKRTLTMEHEWESHLKSRAHRRVVNGAKKRALVASGTRAVQIRAESCRAQPGAHDAASPDMLRILP